MKQIIIGMCFLLFGMTAYAKEEEPKQLYAQSAVLMDADSGRVLFEKNGYEERAMASTTKIMTCILTLENGDVDSVVTASEHAAGQPKVHLGMRRGERFYMRDLLYSLMLESHNDSAVAIAEHIGGSVEEFAKMMNAKAKEIGCMQTHFVTPNGLDASDEGGKHATTAADLAKIMSYCIKKSPQKDLFLKITQTQSYRFQDVDRKRNFSCNNHNAFLSMMEGAISGKTGFTGDAGYCYVGALERDQRTFVVALLGCGWPNHKGYKWLDTRKLMEYGIQNYAYRDVFEEQKFEPVEVINGIPKSGVLFDQAVADVKLKGTKEEQTIPLLLKKEEEPEIRVEIKPQLEAPVRKGEVVGHVTYYLAGQIVKRYPVIVVNGVAKKHFLWYFQKIFALYML